MSLHAKYQQYSLSCTYCLLYITIGHCSSKIGLLESLTSLAAELTEEEKKEDDEREARLARKGLE